MKRHLLAEIRHLKPSLRLALLEGRTTYREQEEPIEVEDDVAKKLLASGELSAAGGQNAAAIDPQLLMRDKIKRAPQRAASE